MSVEEVEELLIGPLSFRGASEVEVVGAGAWSTAFGFSHAGRALVIRIGKHVNDFQRDKAISAFTSPELPIPEVLGVGAVPGEQFTDLYYCISTRAFGIPLERCSADNWPEIAERLADGLETMRSLTPAETAASDGSGRAKRWQDQLLDIERDDLDPRGKGWPAKLATSSNGSEAFALGLDRLRALDVGPVPLTLVHGDLINRNVHIDAGHITGIFDWGCQRWGDHLYDLAWFDFWSPWHPNLDIDGLRTSLQIRWTKAGYTPENERVRSQACLIFIGLEHLIYNATINGWSDLEDVVDRMAKLDLF